MFIVTPYLTANTAIYGIYAVCVSVTIFLNYADLGFLSACQKYAAEAYARENLKEEISYIGFGAFVLLIFTLLLSAYFFYLGLNPHVLLKGLDTPEKINTASHLLFILSGFAPVTIFGRMLGVIYNIRLESYIYNRLSLIGSLITIASVFYFFGYGHYKIVSYFFFSQILNFIVIIAAIYLVHKKYGYNIIELFKGIRFDKKVYKKVHGLAYASLYLMLVWISYYEIDQIVVGKYLGVEKVAVYAIALYFITFFRNIYGIYFSPFVIRANHYIGLDNDEGLKKFFMQLLVVSAPVTILPTVALSLVAKPFILTWVGTNYSESIMCAHFLALYFSLSYITYVSSTLLIVKVRLRESYLMGTISPVVFWLGVFFTVSNLGVLSFALFKYVSIFGSLIYSVFILTSFFKISFWRFIQKAILPVLFPLAFLVLSLGITLMYLPYEKSKFNFLIVASATLLCLTGSFVVQYLVSAEIRKVSKELLSVFFIKNK